MTSSSTPTASTSALPRISSHVFGPFPQNLRPPQPRTSVAPFPAGGSGGYAWNTAPSRGSSAGTSQQLQQQHSHYMVGSPARSHTLASGASPPWMGSPQGQHNGSISTSAWNVPDSIASGARGKYNVFEENQVISFIWVISEADSLRIEVESSPMPSEGGRSVSAGAGKNEVWTTQPIFGDGKWKLELVRTTRPGPDVESNTDEPESAPDSEEGKETEQNNTSTVLSIYLTNLVLDYSAAELEIPASIMIGIKPVQSQSRSSRSASWIWQEFVHHTFRRENEYYECHRMPSLSELLQNADVERQDAFALTIQISTGPRAAARASEQGLGLLPGGDQATPFIVQDNQLVHHSLISGLERLMDCRRTGDVVLIVRERGVVKRQRRASGDISSQDEVWTRPVGTPMFDWGQTQEDTEVVVRDRVLWAHSSILSARSEFFKTMLESNFAEGQEQDLDTRIASIQIQGRRVRTLRIDDADYTTIYWLLRYLYLEEVEFLSDEDVRSAALDDDWMTAGQTSIEEGMRMAVWDWTPLSQIESGFLDNNHRSSTDAGSSHGRGPASPEIMTSPVRSSAHDKHGSHQRRVASDREARRTIARGSTQEAPTPDTQGPSSAAKRDEQPRIFLDPHAHPCEKPPPASALAIYRLAHRYHQERLVHLAKVHLIGSLTPQTAFPTLLATYLYSDLYDHVKAYVLDKWDLVSETSEFEWCCDEVSAGEWGVEAGRALRLFMRSLLSPNRAR